MHEPGHLSCFEKNLFVCKTMGSTDHQNRLFIVPSEFVNYHPFDIILILVAVKTNYRHFVWKIIEECILTEYANIDISVLPNIGAVPVATPGEDPYVPSSKRTIGNKIPETDKNMMHTLCNPATIIKIMSEFENNRS